MRRQNNCSSSSYTSQPESPNLQNKQGGRQHVPVRVYPSRPIAHQFGNSPNGFGLGPGGAGEQGRDMVRVSLAG